VEIVQWGTIDDEGLREYESTVLFSRNLARQLGCGPLWPAMMLTDADIATLTDDARALCPTSSSRASTASRSSRNRSVSSPCRARSAAPIRSLRWAAR